MMLEFVVAGPPRPKQRARRGAGGRWYTPQATRDYERHVGVCAMAALSWHRLLPSQRYDGQSWPIGAEYELEARIVPANRRKMDADNVIKSICDGLIGVLWADDRQVKKVTAEMIEPDAFRPRVECIVRVREESRDVRGK